MFTGMLSGCGATSGVDMDACGGKLDNFTYVNRVYIIIKSRVS